MTNNKSEPRIKSINPIELTTEEGTMVSYDFGDEDMVEYDDKLAENDL